MASSPLEIYEKAYRLHYDENDISRACEIYRQIIAEFPDSTESGYAAIQLQKVQAEDLVRKLDRRRKPAAILMAVAGALCVLALAACAIVGYLSYRHAQTEARKTSLVSQALGLMCLNRDSDALRLLQEAKALQTADVSPYALSADIHLRRGDLANARAEYEAYNGRHGGRSGDVVMETKPGPTAAAAATVQPATDSSAVGGETQEARKRPGGDRLSDKNSVIEFLDSISGTP